MAPAQRQQGFVHGAAAGPAEDAREFGIAVAGAQFQRRTDLPGQHHCLAELPGGVIHGHHGARTIEDKRRNAPEIEFAQTLVDRIGQSSRQAQRSVDMLHELFEHALRVVTERPGSRAPSAL